MARISGVYLPEEKRIDVGLTYIFGIGKNTARQILNQVGISQDKRVKNLTPSEAEKIQSFIEKNYKVEGALKRQYLDNIKRLKQINCYRGIRHIKNLPVRGQRTKTNSRTVRGNVRRVVGGIKPPPAKKV